MEFFAKEFDPNVKFDMYTSMHLVMLVIFIAIVVLFFVFKNRIAESKHEKVIKHSIAYFFIAMQVFIIIQNAIHGKIWLPFHLCSMSYVMAIIVLLTDNEKIFKYLFFSGILGGLVTFAIPELEHSGWNRFRFYEFIIAHTAIMLIPLYYLTNKGYRITLKDTIIGIVITNIIGFSMIPVNMLLESTGIEEGANYMFVMGAPKDVEAVFGQPPLHLLTFELVLLVAFFLLYYAAKVYQKRKYQA